MQCNINITYCIILKIDVNDLSHENYYRYQFRNSIKKNKKIKLMILRKEQIHFFELLKKMDVYVSKLKIIV